MPFLLFLLLAAPAFAEDTVSLALGGDHTCVLEREAVRCFGSDHHGQASPPRLIRPRRIVAGGKHTCALDEEGLKCWGDDSHGQSAVPAIPVPRDVATGESHTCALGDDGVKCWGDDRYGQLRVPVLRRPQAVYAGGDQSCALDDSALFCWGHGHRGAEKMATSQPRVVALGGNFVCLLDEAGVRCPGLPGFGVAKVPKLRAPRALAAGTTHVCALDEEGVKCWGENDSGALDVPRLEHPSFIGAGGGHSCARELHGVKCWGSNAQGQLGTRGDRLELAELSAQHARYLDELTKRQRAALLAVFPNGRIVDRCPGSFTGGGRRQIAVAILDRNPRAPKGEGVYLGHAVIFDSGLEAPQVQRVGTGTPTGCDALDRSCFVGRLRCLNAVEVADFVRELGDRFRVREPAAMRLSADASLCYRSGPVAGRWDCFRYDRKRKRFLSWGDWDYRK